MATSLSRIPPIWYAFGYKPITNKPHKPQATRLNFVYCALIFFGKRIKKRNTAVRQLKFINKLFLAEKPLEQYYEVKRIKDNKITELNNIYQFKIKYSRFLCSSNVVGNQLESSYCLIEEQGQCN